AVLLHFSTNPSSLSSTLFPYTTLFRSGQYCKRCVCSHGRDCLRTIQSHWLNRCFQGFITISKRLQKFFSFFFSKKEPADLESLRSEEHTSELQSRFELVCRLLLDKKKY